MNWIKKLFCKKSKTVDFVKDSSWMLNEDLTPNVENLKKCKEFQALMKTKQPKKWHKEGNAWKHTMLVAKEMHKIISTFPSYISTWDKKVLMIAALCHDLGKPNTTYFDDKENTWKCKNHGFEGEKITRNLILNEDIKFREAVCWLVRRHMNFHHFVCKTREEQYAEIIKLSQGNATIEQLLLLNKADSLGSKSEDYSVSAIEKRCEYIKNFATEHNCYRTPYRGAPNKYDFTMYIMIGVPGSGKDTYIQKFLKGKEVICRDDIREELLDGNVTGRKLYFDNKKENTVTEIVNSRIEKCCNEKRSFVVNQTNMKVKYRTMLKDTAFKFGKPRVVYVYVEAPSLEECKERRGHGKWDSIIDRMWNEFEFPDKSECNELILYKQTSVNNSFALQLN